MNLKPIDHPVTCEYFRIYSTCKYFKNKNEICLLQALTNAENELVNWSYLFFTAGTLAYSFPLPLPVY